jgi:hypothetical protein
LSASHEHLAKEVWRRLHGDDDAGHSAAGSAVLANQLERALLEAGTCSVVAIGAVPLRAADEEWAAASDEAASDAAAGADTAAAAARPLLVPTLVSEGVHGRIMEAIKDCTTSGLPLVTRLTAPVGVLGARRLASRPGLRRPYECFAVLQNTHSPPESAFELVEFRAGPNGALSLVTSGVAHRVSQRASRNILRCVASYAVHFDSSPAAVCGGAEVLHALIAALDSSESDAGVEAPQSKWHEGSTEKPRAHVYYDRDLMIRRARSACWSMLAQPFPRNLSSMTIRHDGTKYSLCGLSQRLDEAERDACAYAEAVGGESMLWDYLRGRWVPGFEALPPGTGPRGALLAATPLLQVRTVLDERVASTQWIADRTVCHSNDNYQPFHAPWLDSDMQEDVIFGGFRALAKLGPHPGLGGASFFGLEAKRALAALHHAASVCVAAPTGCALAP